MARRYCGNLRVDVLYTDYEVYTVKVGSVRFTVNPPACGYGPGVGYDSSEAYDQVARAAVSLAGDGVEPVGEWSDSGPVIRRTKVVQPK